jgi:hypothetical protein
VNDEEARTLAAIAWLLVGWLGVELAWLVSISIVDDY